MATENLDWAGLIINVAAVFIGLFIYLGVVRTRWGREHFKYQFFIMLVCLLAAVLIAWGLRTLFRV